MYTNINKKFIEDQMKQKTTRGSNQETYGEKNDPSDEVLKSINFRDMLSWNSVYSLNSNSMISSVINSRMEVKQEENNKKKPKKPPEKLVFNAKIWSCDDYGINFEDFIKVLSLISIWNPTFKK